MERMLCRGVAGLAIVAMLLGLTAGPTSAAAPPIDTSAVDCASVMNDSNPRWFDLYSTDVGSGNPAGANGWGWIWVDARSDRGYDVCVGSYEYALVPYRATVKDTDADGYGAVVYAEFSYWNGSTWVHMDGKEDWVRVARADGNGAVTGYNMRNVGPVVNFYVHVCRIKLAENRPYDNCSGRG